MTTNTDLMDLDTDDDLSAGTPVVGMVCNALVARDGTTHYVPDWQHGVTATALGFATLDAALNAGMVYVSVAGMGHLEARRHMTDAQANAMWDMYAVASGSAGTRCETYAKAFAFFAREQGIND